MAVLPIDHLSWTGDVATMAHRAMQREDVKRVEDREIWLTGRASERARSELEGRGWKVRESGIEMLLAE